MTGDEPMELHLCEQHANEYLHHSSLTGNGPTDSENALVDTAQELMELDFQTCPVCGMGFQEFRKTGLLGCPNDYNYFSENLEPLLLGIHGDTEHLGKKPSRFHTRNPQTMLIRLRRELNDAVSIEDYERASVLRDQIRAIDLESI